MFSLNFSLTRTRPFGVLPLSSKLHLDTHAAIFSPLFLNPDYFVPDFSIDFLQPRWTLFDDNPVRLQLDPFLPMHSFLGMVDTTLSFISYFPVLVDFPRILISARLLGSRPGRIMKEKELGWNGTGIGYPNCSSATWIFRGLATALTFPNAPKPRLCMCMLWICNIKYRKRCAWGDMTLVSASAFAKRDGNRLIECYSD